MPTLTNSPYFQVLVFILCTQSMMAQGNNLDGHILDHQGNPLSFANVLLYHQKDTSLVKGAISNENGFFQMPQIYTGKYFLEVSYVGLPHLHKTLSLVDESSFQLGKLQFQEPQQQELAEITVTATKPLLEIKDDKTIFNVDQSLAATGDDGLTLLQRAPGVMIGPNQQITLLGQGNVRIYINNRPTSLRGSDLASYLASFQSDQIEAIEIITNPGAKYDAEGSAGIINLRLAKPKGMGANGQVGLGYEIGIRNRYRTSISANYRNEITNIYGNYGWSQSHNVYRLTFDRQQNDFTNYQKNDMYTRQMPHILKLGADFQISEKAVLGLLFDGNYIDFNNDIKSFNQMGTLGQAGIDSLLIASRYMDSRRWRANMNINYDWQINKDASLQFDANVGTYDKDQSDDQPNFYTDPARQSITSQNINQIQTATDIFISSLKADYTQKLPKGNIALGFKLGSVTTENDFQFFDVIDDYRVMDLDRSNDFSYEEWVMAAYLDYDVPLNEQWKGKFGLRVEDTRSVGLLEAFGPSRDNKVDRSYRDWFPSASLTYSPNKNHQWQFSFSRRINRPVYSSLNPFEKKLDELSYNLGNPFLKPEYANLYQVKHVFKRKWNTTLKYTNTQDLMALQPFAVDEKLLIQSWINLAEQKDFSLNVSVPHTLKDWWRSYVSLTGFYRENQSDFGDGQIVDLSATSFNFYSQQSFTISKRLAMELSGFYYAPSVVQASFESKAMWTVDWALKLKLQEEKADLSVAFTDIFASRNWDGRYQLGRLQMDLQNRWDTRRFKINYRLKFGNNSVKSARKRKTGLEDEKKRSK